MKVKSAKHVIETKKIHCKERRNLYIDCHTLLQRTLSFSLNQSLD